ncbi:MAG: phosphoribosylformylglycinamidine synthase subunit PurS [Saprospiraceae bacterium]|nr:phosphoribosylformylglycinamidine synthase subunit PurS [Saprospiraceae bacterium]MBP7679542.1 phosphoribosylformylglycinamidine synthase subunit PurS [Saprospiraceae bacterium]
MNFIAEINIMPHKELLDPKGKTIANNLKHLNLHGISDVRVGTHITLQIEADDEQSAHDITTQACKMLLANPIMETFSFTLHSGS